MIPSKGAIYLKKQPNTGPWRVVCGVVKDICYVLILQEPSQKGRHSLSVGEMQRYLLSSPVSAIISFYASIRDVSGVVPGI